MAASHNWWKFDLAISYTQRKWNSIEKVWLFNPKLKDFVIKILMEHYGKVLVFEGDKQEILERKTSKMEEEIQEILEKEGF